METARPTIIAIDGRSGSGKSTFASSLAQHLSESYSVAVLRLENLYHGWHGLAAAYQMYNDLLPILSTGQTLSYPTWDWAANTVGEEQTFTPAQIVIIEGVGALNDKARTFIDFGIWLQAPEDFRRDRALARDGQTYRPYWSTWAEQEEQYLRSNTPITNADLSIDTNVVADPLRSLRAACCFLPHELSQRLGFDDTAWQAPAFRQSYQAPADVAALFEQLTEQLPHAALLESTSQHLEDPLGRNRYSIMAFSTDAHPPILTATAEGTFIALDRSRLNLGQNFFESLATVWPNNAEQNIAYPLPLWVGYLGYELKREVDASNIAAVIAPNQTRADAQFFAPDTIVVVDHQLSQMHLHSSNKPAAPLAILLGNPPLERQSKNLPVPMFSCADSAQGYQEKILRAQHEIYEGNTYEVCLTTELTASVDDFDPFEAYCRMRLSSPAPFAHYLRIAELEVASISPERFVSLSHDGQLRAEPIKGTRKRGLDEESDLALKHDLATHPKDRAENIMIVDLLRNDLSHFAVPGSVKVTRLCSVETYATVHQMVSTIDATLSNPHLAAAALREAFPPGSMTGAPKLSTMNILDELEEHRARGLYSGAVGYLGANGAADFSVVIRTLVCDRLVDQSWRLSLGLGGAITADSDPQEEWDEVITKSRGVLNALGASFGQITATSQ